MTVNNLPSSMLAAQVVEFDKPYKINQVSIPSDNLGPTDLLVKVAVGSYCHTDAMVTSGKFDSSLPITGSHEGAGTVVLTGSEVKNYKPGDRIMCGMMRRDGCGKCPTCKGPEDYRHYCPIADPDLGIRRDGAFAEYLVCHAGDSNILPDTVSFETAAPLACAGRTIYRGVVQSKVPKGEWLGLVGSGGGLGHLGIQFAKAFGMKVVGIDARDEGLDLSKHFGADVVVDARKDKESVVKEVQEATGGQGCYATVNISDGKTAAALACAITRMHGRMIQIAAPDDVCVPFPELIFRDIRIEGSLLCSAQQSQDMLEMVAAHGIRVNTNPFHGLEKLPELLELVHSGKLKGKGVIIIDEKQ